MQPYESVAADLRSEVPRLDRVHRGTTHVLHPLAQSALWIGRLLGFWLSELGRTDVMLADSWDVSGWYDPRGEDVALHRPAKETARAKGEDSPPQVQVNTSRAPESGTAAGTSDSLAQ